MARVLVVDDERSVCEVIKLQLAEEGFDVEIAYDGREGLQKVASFTPDVVLTDVLMPIINGIDMCRQIKENPDSRFVPVMLMTTMADRAKRLLALEAGADEFLNKPIDSVEMMTRLRALIRMKKLVDQLEDSKNIIQLLANAIEAKDGYTVEHTERVRGYALGLAKKLGVPEEKWPTVEYGALLHDVGKIGIPEEILKKPASLTVSEYEVIKRHPMMGVQICQPVKFLRNVLTVIRYHHERIDGTGYPDGLKGEDIPIEARIVSVADAFDAMVSDRPYRKGLPLEKAIQILREGRGTQWDAQVVDEFITMIQTKMK